MVFIDIKYMKFIKILKKLLKFKIKKNNIINLFIYFIN